VPKIRTVTIKEFYHCPQQHVTLANREKTNESNQKSPPLTRLHALICCYKNVPRSHLKGAEGVPFRLSGTSGNLDASGRVPIDDSTSVISSREKTHIIINHLVDQNRKVRNTNGLSLRLIERLPSIKSSQAPIFHTVSELQVDIQTRSDVDWT
jgi:hypothetical protein